VFFGGGVLRGGLCKRVDGEGCSQCKLWYVISAQGCSGCWNGLAPFKQPAVLCMITEEMRSNCKAPSFGAALQVCDRVESVLTTN
jgi:hypothetical protein